MPNIVETFELASFDGVEFPWVEYSIKGSLDHHVHKYIHRPGGEVEDLGRHLYEFRFHLEFHETDLVPWLGKYPGNMLKIVELYEGGGTHMLVVPGVGHFKAKIIGLDRHFIARILSGEKADLTFLEDGKDLFSTQALFGFASATLPAQIEQLRIEVDRVAPLLQGPTPPLPAFDEAPTLLDQISDAIDVIEAASNAVLVARDQAELGMDMVATKVNGLIAACQVLDQLFTTPLFASASEPLFSIWESAVDARDDQLESGLVLETYVTDKRMSVIDLSLRLYGNTDQVSTLMHVNDFEDALSIRPGSSVRYYGPTLLFAEAA
jgi:hypothetical protein